MREAAKKTNDRLFEKIIQALKEMPEPLGRIFALSHYSGLSPEQIAREVEVQATEVELLVRQAENLLHERLRPLVPETKHEHQGKDCESEAEYSSKPWTCC